MSCGYLGSSPRRQEVCSEEHSDDCCGGFRERYSDDNGGTSSDGAPVSARKSRRGEAVQEVLDLAYGYDPVSGRAIHLALQRVYPKGAYSGGCSDHTLCRVSADEGRTWTDYRVLRHEDGPESDDTDWVNAEYLGTNHLYAGYNVEAFPNRAVAIGGCWPYRTRTRTDGKRP